MANAAPARLRPQRFACGFQMAVKQGAGSNPRVRASRSPTNPSSPYTTTSCTANTVQNKGCGSGSERASGGSDGNNSGTAAAAAMAMALERTSADFRSSTRRTTPYLRVAARLSSCAGVTCKTLPARRRDGSSVTESSWSISTDILKADGGRIKQSFAEISLLRSDDTDARKATVRRFGRSDRRAQRRARIARRCLVRATCQRLVGTSFGCFTLTNSKTLWGLPSGSGKG